MTRVLLTSTSFQDTPGEHHQLLADSGFEIVRARGPLPEPEILALVGDIDGMICGDDAITRQVIASALPRLRVISKYGIGVDKIDVKAATELGVPLLFTPGVNHTTVAEHAMLLILSLHRHLIEEANHTRAGRWKRLTGHEVMGRNLAIAGLGRIGKEVAVRARAFGLALGAFDCHWDEAFAAQHEIRQFENFDEMIAWADILSLHTNLTDQTRGIVNRQRIATMKPGSVIVNTARGELVETDAVREALDSGHLAGYGTDVLDREPPPPDHPLLSAPNCIVTPHIGSRTYESVLRQATMSVENLLLAMAGKPPLAQVNSGVPIRPPTA